MVCPSCSYKNVNDNALFCGGCGKPLVITAAKPGAGALSAEIVQLSKDQLPGGGPLAARTLSRTTVAIAALLVCLVIGVGELVLVHHSRANAAKLADSTSTGTNDSAATTQPTTSQETESASAASGSQPDSTGANPAAVFTPGIPVVTPSSQVPSGTNIVASDFGGEIESVKGAYGGPGLQGEMLINGAVNASWQPDTLAHPPQSLNDGVFEYPQEIVFSFYKRDTAMVSAVVLENVQDAQAGPNAAEVWISRDNSPANFQPVAGAQLKTTVPVQTISFTPVETRYVKVRLLSGSPDNLQLHQVEIIEGSQPDYTSLLARHPDLPNWKPSVRHAAQRGIDWLEAAAMDWQEHQRCYGCHVQAQTMMGLSIAETNNYVVNVDTLRNLVAFMNTKQDTDGNEKDEGSGNIRTATHFAAMGMAYYDEASGLKNDLTMKRFADWMLSKIDKNGAFPQDLAEDPVAQGTINPTANAITALMEAYVQTGNAKYMAAADHGLAYIASEKTTTTQDGVFKVMALSHYGTPAQRTIAASALEQLKGEQDSDGGWHESSEELQSSAFATGQVLYAFKEAGVSPDSPEFSNGVRYLLKTQDPSGSWPALSNRPSNFAPTMWAVIALAGNVDTPSADSLKSQLDKYGKVILYINFDFNKSTIRPDGKPIVTQVLKLLKDNPDLSLSINGHTDNVGTRNYNLRLSQQRASAVVAALVVAGITPNRLTSAGFGPDQPIADNSTEKGRAKNRRVELVKM